MPKMSGTNKPLRQRCTSCYSESHHSDIDGLEELVEAEQVKHAPTTILSESLHMCFFAISSCKDLFNAANDTKTY